MDSRFEVTVGAGTMRSAVDRVVSFPHRWTPEGVTVDADFTGGDLLPLAAPGCVVNDVYPGAAAPGLGLNGGRGAGAGGVDTGTLGATGRTHLGAINSRAPGPGRG